MPSTPAHKEKSMQRHDALYELARRARAERSLFIAEALSEVLVDTYRFCQRLFTRPEAAGSTKRPAVPATQR